MNTQTNTKLNTTTRAKASTPLAIPSWSRKPTRKLTIVMTSSPQTCIAVSATARPVSTAPRGIGKERNRSSRPWARSSVMLMAAPIPCQMSMVVTMPGTTKSTYPSPPAPIAPPKMQRKMTRNITPWIVLVHSSCGVRRNLSRLRLAITSVLDARDARAAATATALAMTNLPWDATRERQERLVEPRRAQRHLLEGDPALLERQQGAVELLGAALHRHGDPVGRRIDLRLAVADRGEGLGDLGEVAAVADVDLDHVAPRALLQLGGRAVRDGPAVVDDHDPVGEP